MKTMKKTLFRILSFVGIICILLVGADYGQHFYLKKQIQKTLVFHEGGASADKVRLRFSPLQSRVQISGIKLHYPRGEATLKKLTLRQKPLDLFQVTIKGESLKAASATDGHDISIEKIDGVIACDVWGSKNKRVDVHSLELRNSQTKILIKPSIPPIELNAKLLVLKGSYDRDKNQIAINSVIPKIHVNQEDASFGLSIDGNVTTPPTLSGKIDLRIRNLKHLVKHLTALKLVGRSEAKIALFALGGGGNKDQEVPISLTISESKLWLGPIPLMDLSVSQLK